MLTKENINRLDLYIKNLAKYNPVKLEEFEHEERVHILKRIRTQTGKMDFIIEANGTIERPETITKFRKINKPIKEKEETNEMSKTSAGIYPT